MGKSAALNLKELTFHLKNDNSTEINNIRKEKKIT